MQYSNDPDWHLDYITLAGGEGRGSMPCLGLAAEFCSERFPLFRGRVCSFRGIPKFTEESIPKLGTERNDMKKISFTKNPAPANKIDSVFFSETCFRTKFREVCNQQQPQVATNFVPRNGISSWFLFRGIVWNRIPIVCFYFCSTLQNSQHFSPVRCGSEQNSESFLFRGTAGIPPEQTNCFVNSVFLGKIFLSEIVNLSRAQMI